MGSAMVDFATIETCSEITSEHAKQAASSSAEIRAFLSRMAEIARPDEGCPKTLMAVARLVGQSWVEGDLRVELTGDEEQTTLTIICEYGMGIRERLLPATTFNGVPLDEFSRALHLAPALALPLRVKDEPGKIVLAPLLTPEDRMESAPAPDFQVEEKSLGEHERKTAPPPDTKKPHEIPTPPAGIVALSPPDELDEAWDIPIEARARSEAPLPPASPPSALPLPFEPSELTVLPTHPSEQPPTPRVALEEPREPSLLMHAVDPEASARAVAPPDVAPQDELIPVDDDGVPLLQPLEEEDLNRTSGVQPAMEAGDERPKPTVHTRPTVRRMVAIDVAAVKRHDPRREED